MLQTESPLPRPQVRRWNPAAYGPQQLAAAEHRARLRSPEATVPLTFPRGLLAFPDAQHFLLRPLGDPRLPQLLLLQGEGPDAPRFLVMGPRAAGASLPAAEMCMTCRRLEVEPEDARWFLIVTVDWDGKRPDFYANCRAPLLIDSRRRLGWQRILVDEAQSLRRPLAS